MYWILKEKIKEFQIILLIEAIATDKLVGSTLGIFGIPNFQTVQRTFWGVVHPDYV